MLSIDNCDVLKTQCIDLDLLSLCLLIKLVNQKRRYQTPDFFATKANMAALLLCFPRVAKGPLRAFLLKIMRIKELCRGMVGERKPRV